MDGARECEICDELASSTSPDHYLFRGIPPEGRVIVESEHFVLVPDYAPLMPGHLLLLARTHALSMADYLADVVPRIAELAELLDDYAGHYGQVSIVEHGSTAEVEREHPCIAHAHLHLLPLVAGDLQSVFVADMVNKPPIVPWADVVNQGTGVEYVLVGDRNRVVLATNWRPPSRQYARSLVARVIGLTEAQTHSDTCVAPGLVASTISEWVMRRA